MEARILGPVLALALVPEQVPEPELALEPVPELALVPVLALVLEPALDSQ